MRVLFLSHNRSDSNDAYNYRLRTLRRLLSADPEIDARIAYLGDGRLGAPTLLHPLKIRSVEGIGEADVIHAGSAAVAFSCSFLPRRTSRRLIFDMHGDTVAEQDLAAVGGGLAGGMRVPVERWKERRGLRFADRLIVVSAPLRNHAVALGYPPERIEIVRNGVDLDLFSPGREDPVAGPPLVVYAGRFDRWQGVDLLIGLASLAGERFHLRVIGLTTEDREVRSRLSPFEKSGVELVDRLPQERLLPLLREADAFLIPRESHAATEVAMPTKFAEYLALGKPVIITRVGEPASLVEKERCGIVTDADAGSVAEGIAALGRASPDERRAMGERARRLAEEQFDWEKIGQKYARFLKEPSGGRSEP